MPKKIYTAIDPNGGKHKRTTARRTLTHVVVARLSYDEQLRRAGDATIHAATDRYRYDFYRRELDPMTRKMRQRSDAELAPLIEAMGDCKSEAEFLAAEAARRAAEVRVAKVNGEFAKYRVLEWCAGLDRAQQSASKAAREGGYLDITILDAVALPPKPRPLDMEAMG